jgi:hypothetical protein
VNKLRAGFRKLDRLSEVLRKQLFLRLKQCADAEKNPEENDARDDQSDSGVYFHSAQKPEISQHYPRRVVCRAEDPDGRGRELRLNDQQRDDENRMDI